MTLVDVWIDGKLRSISVGRDAIAKMLQLPPDRAAGMTDDECRDFVRTRLSLIAGAAKDRLQGTNASADAVTITAMDLSGGGAAKVAERRKGDRRKRERRAPGQAAGRIGDRRQTDRRKADRRTTPPDDGSPG
jgi:hypothetical protein